MSRTERSPFMRIVRFVLFIALVGGLAYGAMWVLHRPVALADIAAGPEAYATREVPMCWGTLRSSWRMARASRSPA